MATKILLLYCMIFCHIVDDYHLQGVLARMKQKKWWEENAPQSFYSKDYIAALIAHGFSWSFMVHLPLTAYGLITHNERTIIACLLLMPLHALAHAYVDNEKANKYTYNLIYDQVTHVFQILMIWSCVLFVVS